MKIELYNKLSMELPEGFTAIDREEQKKYFGQTQADYAYILEEKQVFATIVRTGTDLTDDKVETQIAAYQQYYSRMVPGYKQGEMRISRKAGRNVAFMTYKSNAPTRDLYNMLAVTTLDGKELVILLACDMQDSINYMYKFLRILDSLQFFDALN